MEIHVLIYDEISGATRNCVVEIDKNETMQGLLDILSLSAADLTDYYPFNRSYYRDDDVLPFVFLGKRTLYSVSYRKVKITDFLYTHNITDGTIRLVTGYPGAGGFGFESVRAIWDAVSPVLGTVADICGITGFNIKDFWNWLKEKFIRRGRTPPTVLDIVYSRDAWNHRELGDRLRIDHEQAKKLLQALGYVYDRSRMQYVQCENIDKIKDKLLHVAYH